MKFEIFDTRHYPMLDVREGYGEWAASYEATVLDVMDHRLLARLTPVNWPRIELAADLGCGTGRTGAWLKTAGVRMIDGIDLTPQMLDRARAKGVYRQLEVGDVASSSFERGAYDLVVNCLVDEHLADLTGLYNEARRLLRPGGRFVLVGYHPHFLMLGIAAHFDRENGDSIGVESHVHLTSDHVAAGHGAGFRLLEMIEGLVDEDWAELKPKWAKRYWGHPVTFAMVWELSG
jgi:SAM-dependent methyltransferase